MFFILPQYSFIIYYCFYVISFISCPPCFNHIYVVYSTEFSGFLFSSFISLYFLNTSLLIYESIKDSEIKLWLCLILFLLAALFCQAFFLFLGNWLILFKSYSGYLIFYFYRRSCNSNRNSNYWSTCINWNTSTNCCSKYKQVLNIF